MVPEAPARISDWRVHIRQYDWDVAVVERIILCESGGRADAVSADGRNWGLGQVNLVHLARVGGDPYALLDPATNIRVMYDIYVDNAGFSPWSCY
jgi:soluble lytic murein transglycosylase-like protein